MALAGDFPGSAFALSLPFLLEHRSLKHFIIVLVFKNASFPLGKIVADDFPSVTCENAIFEAPSHCTNAMFMDFRVETATPQFMRALIHKTK